MAILDICRDDHNGYYPTDNHSNKDAVKNVIRYITRSRWNEYRQSDLLFYSGYGVPLYDPLYSDIPARMIDAFEFIQNKYHINERGGPRIYHEALSLTDDEYFSLGNNPNSVLASIASQCALCYMNAGFQVVYAVHYDTKKHAHFHFAVNSINALTGLKFETSMTFRNQREIEFNRLLYSMINNIRSTSTETVSKDSFMQPSHTSERVQSPNVYYGFYCSHALGVFDNWVLLRAEIEDIPHKRYQKFNSLEKAREFAIDGFHELQYRTGNEIYLVDLNKLKTNKIYTRAQVRCLATI